MNNYNAIPLELRNLPNCSGIYRILNIINNKIYIGSSIETKKRFEYHRSFLNLNKHHNKYLQSAWNKYGKQNFRFEIIEVVEDKVKLVEREQYWMDVTKCYDPNIGYNLRPVANNNSGYKFSDESKNKLSKSKKGFKHTELAKSKMRFKKPEMSERMKGNKYRQGYKYSEEDKIKLRMQPRKLDKWPHEKGSECRCNECREKWAAYHRDRRTRMKLNVR